LITRAPSSASWRVANGPAMTCSSATNRDSLERPHEKVIPEAFQAGDLGAPTFSPGATGVRVGQHAGGDDFARRERRRRRLLAQKFHQVREREQRAAEDVGADALVDEGARP